MMIYRIVNLAILLLLVLIEAIYSGSDGKTAYVNLKDNDGETALHLAVLNHHGNSTASAAIAKLLLEHGADLEARNNLGCTPLLEAIKANGQKPSLAAVQVLLEWGADMEAKERNGLTPIFLAIQYGHNDIVDMLLQKGVNIQAKSLDGYTPLDMVASRIANITESGKSLIKYAVLQNPRATKPDNVASNAELSRYWDDCKNKLGKNEL